MVVFSTVRVLAEPGSADYINLVLSMTFLVGAMQPGMRLAWLGALMNFISHSVVVGFTAGAGLLIAASQLRNFFGVSIPRGASFFEAIDQFALQCANINPSVAVVGTATIASGILVRRYWPVVPYKIIGILTVSLVAMVIYSRFGSAVVGIQTVGAINGTLPPWFTPDFTRDTLRRIAPAALAVAIVDHTEAISTALRPGTARPPAY